MAMGVPVMMKDLGEILEPFTAAQLQTFLAVAGVASDGGFELADLRDHVEQALKNRVSAINSRKIQHRPGRLCPSCRKGTLQPVDTGDEPISVLGCRRCRYSEVIGI